MVKHVIIKIYRDVFEKEKRKKKRRSGIKYRKAQVLVGKIIQKGVVLGGARSQQNACAKEIRNWDQMT